MRSKVLIVESTAALADIWAAHLQRCGMMVEVVTSPDAAIESITHAMPDIIVMNLVLEGGSALAVSDFASYRCPEMRVIFVTNTTFFSDGSIFAHAQNACAFLQSETPPEDLAVLVEHYAVTH